MPDPATQFQPAGLNVGYQYTPVETKLNPPIELPSAAPYIAGIGKAATEAGQAIMNSPLNPLVREKMKLGIASAKTGEQYLKQLQDDPEMVRYLGGITGDEFHTVAGANAGLSYRIQHGTGNEGESGHPGTNTTVKTTTDNTTTSTAGADQYYLNPATGSYEKIQSAAAAANTTKPPPAPAVNPAQQTNQELPSGQEQRLQGNPPMTYVAPSQQQAGSSMFASNAQTPPPSAPLDVSQVPGMVRAVGPTGEVNPTLAASTDTGSAIQLARNQPQAQAPSPVGDQLMAKWQNQNAHPVASVQDAMQWAKTFDSRITDATYMPHGGPLNQPAYAFHMKGGATNMVPLSQMVQNGFAPHVAGSNLSMSLSAADQVRQQSDQQMQPTGDVSGQQQQAQQGDWSKAVAPYVNLPSKGGPGPQYLSADISGSSTSSRPASQEPVVNGSPGINHGDGSTNVSSNPEVTFAKVFDGNTPAQVQESLNKVEPNHSQTDMAGNSYLGTVGGYPWYKDSDTGVYYATRPGEQSIWDQSRFYVNSDHWSNTPIPANLLRQNLSSWDPSLSWNDITKMNEGQLKARLQTAYYVKNILPQTAPADQRTTETLDGLRSQILIGNRLLDATADLHPSQYDTAAVTRNDAAIWRQRNAPPPNAGFQGIGQNVGRFLNASWYGDQPENPRLTWMLDQNTQLHHAVGEQQTISEEEKRKNAASIPDMTRGDPDWRSQMGRWVNDRQKDYQRAVTAAMKNNVRIRAEDVQNVADSLQGNRMYDVAGVDAATKYGYNSNATDRIHPNGAIAAQQNRNNTQPTATPRPTPSPSATPSPSPSATPSAQVNSKAEYDAFARSHPSGTEFIGPDGKRYRTR